MSSAGPPQGARAPSPGSAAAKTQARGDHAGLAARVFRVVAIGVALLWSLVPPLAAQVPPGEATRLDPTWWPHEVTFANYRGLFGESLPFASFFVNTVLTCLVTAIVAVVVAMPAAYALSRAKFRLRAAFGYSILVFRMLPLVVLLAPLYLLLLHVHLLDSALGLIVGFTTFALPFAVWMLKSFIDALPVEIEEAARIDGYPRWQILLKIIVPLILPGLLTTGTFVFMEAWNNLIYPLTFVTTLEKYERGEMTPDKWGGMMAAAVVTTLPLMIAFFVVHRSMVRGLTSGAVAGA